MSKILVISDLHVGSKYAVMPSKGWDGRSPNDEQKIINKKWVEMCKNVEPDYLIINGDVVDGLQMANQGKELWTADIQEQVNAAENLVKQINYGKLLVTFGSPYHTKENINADEMFAKQINAYESGHELHFKPVNNEDVLHASHQISVSTASWQYRSTPVAKELVAAALNKEYSLYDYRCIIRSHAHYYCKVEFSKNFGFITPCWQGRTPYMIRKGISLIPKLGYVVIDTEDGWSTDVQGFDLPRPTLTEC